MPGTDNLFAGPPAFYLVVLDRFKGFFIRHGVDYEQLRLIVQVKMTMHHRALQNPLAGASSARRAAPGSAPRTGQSLWKGILFQGIFGILFALLLLLPLPDDAAYFILYSIFFILFVIMLIPQLAQIFLSVEDAQVLPVRPVDSRVLSLAKVLQVTIYYAINYLAYIVPALIAGLLRRGPAAALLAIPTSLLLSAFALLLALASYLLVARFFNGEKLRNMVTYVQILLSVCSFAVYHMITPLIQVIGKLELLSSPLILIWPPAWFAAPYALMKPAPVPIAVPATVLGPVAVLGLGALYLARSARLEKRLQDLALQKDGAETSTGKIRDFCSGLLCRSPQERAYFRFTWQMMRHERSFKVAVYPLLLSYAALPYLMLLTARGESLKAGIFPGMPVFFLYMSIAGITNVLLAVQMSDYAEAGWIFRIIPENSDGRFATALAKSVWAKLYLPIYILQLPLQYLTNGRSGVLTIGILIFLSYLVMQIFILKMPLVRPFTQKRALIQPDGCGYMVVLLGLWIALAVLQGVLQAYVPWGMAIYSGALALLSVLSIAFYRGKKVFRDA